MPNVRQISKPSEDISDYEWNMTPAAVKMMLNELLKLLQQKQTETSHLQLENQWLREQLDLRIEQSSQVAPPLIPEILLWAMVGLILTIGGTFMEASTISASSLFKGEGITAESLGVTFQIGAVLLTGCLGGKNAALISQIAYLGLGLIGLPIFSRGGGWEYVFEPHFGYLLGFVVGAWLCGYFAFPKLASINSLMVSCAAGLFSIHLVGIIYLTILYYVRGLTESIDSLSQGIYLYSFAPLPGQLAVICSVIAIAFVARKVMLS